MDKWKQVVMKLPYRTRKPAVVPGETGEDGDFIQLRIVREQRSPKPPSLPPKPSPSKILPEEPLKHQPNTEIENIRAELFQAVKDDDENQRSPNPPSLPSKPSPPKILPEEPLKHQPNTEIENIRAELFQAVKDDDENQVKEMLVKLKQQHVPVTSQLACHPETNENIWHYALSKNSRKIIDFLLKNKDDSLIMSNHKIERSGIQGKYNALHRMIEKGDVKMVETILGKLSSPDQQCRMIKTETAVDIRGQRPRLLSCLHLAAYYGQTYLVKHFLDKGMDVNHMNGKKDTALLWAARWGHVELVEALLNLETVDPELQNDKGSTALHWAVRYGHEKTVELLLKKASPNTERKIGLVAPLVVASAYGNNDIVTLLLGCSHTTCDVNIKIRGGERPIHHAAREGHIEVLENLLDHGAQLNAKDELGDTPLLLAAQYGHVELVNKLLQRDTNVLDRNHEGHDTWYYAIESENEDFIEKLLKACANKNIDMKSRPPLCIAAGRGRHGVIEILLKLKQDPLIRDKNGNTFLHYAAMNNKDEIIQKFCAKIPINTQNMMGNTPLHIACSKGFDQTINTLLENEAKANIQNKEEETALHVAAYSKNIKAKTVKKLVTYANDTENWEMLQAKDYKGNNCLHVAGKHAEPDVIWEYRTVSVNDRDKDGYTPLHKAVRPGQPECLDKMLDIFESRNRHGSINEQSYVKCETVLHLAAEEGFSKCVTRLIDLGADLSVADKDGNTVLHRLTQATVLTPRHLKRHLDVFDTVLNRVVKWWCIKENIDYPGEDNCSDYMDLKKDATLFLINEVINEERLSVLALSFKVGVPDISSRLLMMPGVTMFEIKDKDDTIRSFFDISPLIPRTNNALKGCCRSTRISHQDENDVPEKAKRGGKEGACSSWPDYLISQEDKTRTSQILNLPPIKMIENYYISIVAWTFSLLMFFHVVYMSIFTYVGVDLLSKLRNESANASDPETLLMVIIVPIEPFFIIIYIVIKMLGDIRCRFTRSPERSFALSVISAVLSVISAVLSAISAYMFLLFVYAALVIAWIVLFSVRYSYQDYVLAPALCIGWLLSISFTRGFQKIHYFYRLLLSMISRDVSRFSILYLFVLLAFGFAFHVLFQVSSSVVKEYETPGDTLFLFFNMMIGMAEQLFDDNFTTNMSDVGRTVTYLKLFYLLYIILSSIILINLLIALMNDSYSNIRRETEITWMTDSISLGMAIETSCPASKLFSKISIYQAPIKSDTTPPTSGLDKLTAGRWYVYKDEAICDNKDIGSENAAELSSRIEEIENKTNVQLQQINEALGKLCHQLELRINTPVTPGQLTQIGTTNADKKIIG